MTEFRSNVPLDTEWIISEMILPANLLATTDKPIVSNTARIARQNIQMKETAVW